MALSAEVAHDLRECPMNQACLPILVLLVLTARSSFAVWPATPLEAEHHLHFQDGNSLYRLLSSSVNRGDSLEDVEELQGQGIPVVKNAGELHEQLQEIAQADPEHYPDGIFATDGFAGYSFGHGQIVLQFRNQTLVNHRPETFQNWQPPQDPVGRDSMSSVGGAGRSQPARSQKFQREIERHRRWRQT